MSQTKVNVRKFKPDEIRCNVPVDILGKGSFGTVLLAFHHQRGEIAVKCRPIRGNERERKEILKEYRNEVELLLLAHHDNIINVHGLVGWPGWVGIVTEYMPGGSLHELIFNPDVVWIPLLWYLKVCHEMADAISYLHKMWSKLRIAHGDLKPKNVLLTADLRSKIADFGGAALSHCTTYLAQDTVEAQTGTQHTLLYSAPERLTSNSNKLRTSMDVYSYGMIVYVALLRQVPSFANDIPVIMTSKILQGVQLDLIEINKKKDILRNNNDVKGMEILSLLERVLSECVKKLPDRPNMFTVKSELAALLKTFSTSEIIQSVQDILKTFDIPSLKLKELSNCTLDETTSGTSDVEIQGVQVRRIRNMPNDSTVEASSGTLTHILSGIDSSAFTQDCIDDTTVSTNLTQQSSEQDDSSAVGSLTKSLHGFEEATSVCTRHPPSTHIIQTVPDHTLNSSNLEYERPHTSQQTDCGDTSHTNAKYSEFNMATSNTPASDHPGPSGLSPRTAAALVTRKTATSTSNKHGDCHDVIKDALAAIRSALALRKLAEIDNLFEILLQSLASSSLDETKVNAVAEEILHLFQRQNEIPCGHSFKLLLQLCQLGINVSYSCHHNTLEVLRHVIQSLNTLILQNRHHTVCDRLLRKDVIEVMANVHHFLSSVKNVGKKAELLVQAACWKCISDCHFLDDKLETSLNCIEQSYVTLQKLEENERSLSLYAACCNNLANRYVRNNQAGLAESCLFKALRCCVRAQDFVNEQMKAQCIYKTMHNLACYYERSPIPVEPKRRNEILKHLNRKDVPQNMSILNQVMKLRFAAVFFTDQAPDLRCHIQKLLNDEPSINYLSFQLHDQLWKCLRCTCKYLFANEHHEIGLLLLKLGVQTVKQTEQTNFTVGALHHLLAVVPCDESLKANMMDLIGDDLIPIAMEVVQSIDSARQADRTLRLGFLSSCLKRLAYFHLAEENYESGVECANRAITLVRMEQNVMELSKQNAHLGMCFYILGLCKFFSNQVNAANVALRKSMGYWKSLENFDYFVKNVEKWLR
ncbi:unnamed protein product [Clavelina lepadiformis]|uniref:Protein kinase domain-containing protein n=1 Tax=Clavelina lepadiformis TaxID=159417 RepID=A0ABP0GQV1_CLALP